MSDTGVYTLYFYPDSEVKGVFASEKLAEEWISENRNWSEDEYYIEYWIVQKEVKKYNVILPNILRDRKPILLCKSFDDHESCGIDWSPKDWLDDNMDRHIFTEQEIKDIDERYLAFKVEVKDE